MSLEDVLVFAFVAFNNVLSLWFGSSLLMCHVSPSTSYLSGFSPRSSLVRLFCASWSCLPCVFSYICFLILRVMLVCSLLRVLLLD